MSLTLQERLEVTQKKMQDLGDQTGKIFTSLYWQQTHAAAQAAHARQMLKCPLGPLDGLFVSIKDMFDMAGETTTAGSILLKGQPPATQDADVVQRLRAAGAIILGKTNMTEFAFSGLGVNPHYGTPHNIYDTERIPGGSSSGAALSVAHGLVDIAIGTDTGGSVRIPAAMNGLVGFKPSQHRYSRKGLFPLSPTLDTVGTIARNVNNIYLADSILAQHSRPLVVRPIKGLRVLLPSGSLFQNMDPFVNQALHDAFLSLSKAGAVVQDEDIDRVIQQVIEVQKPVSIASTESVWVHQAYLDTKVEYYDPRVRERIVLGRQLEAWRYIAMLQERQALYHEIDTLMAPWDVLALPTVPIIAPKISDVEPYVDYFRLNSLVLRNPSIFNFFDLPAITLPVPAGGQGVGLMLVGKRGEDTTLLSMARGVEHALTYYSKSEQSFTPSHPAPDYSIPVVDTPPNLASSR